LIKKFLLGAMLALGLATPSFAWDLDELNRRVDQNLFSVGKGCAGTLVNPTEGVIITAYHCIADAIKEVREDVRDNDGIIKKDGDDKPINKVERVVSDIPVYQQFYRSDDVDEMDRLVYPAEIIARSQPLDVAILKIRSKVGPYSLPMPAAAPITLAPKNYDFQRGKTVWAVGNPKGFYGTVTRGIISSYRDLERELNIPDNKLPSPVVQYDGGIYFGSSGGALYDDNGVYLGIGFALVPGTSDEALTFMGLFTPTPHIWKVADEACISNLLGGVNPEKCVAKAKATD
jgi:S1-C subfamily serine protease